MKRLLYCLLLSPIIGLSAVFACDIQIGFTAKSKQWVPLESKTIDGIIYVELTSDMDSLNIQFTSACTGIAVQNVFYNEAPLNSVVKENQINTSNAKGLYKIQVVGPQNPDWFRVIVKIKDVTSVNEIANKLQFLLFPNPAIDQVNIQSDANIKGIQIFDNKGALVFEKLNFNFHKEESIDISELPSGQYFILCNSNTTQASTRFIKQ